MSNPALETATDFSALSVLAAIQSRRIAVDAVEVGAFLRGKVVLVTGAGGTVGAELCRRLVPYDPAKIVLLENDENRLKDAVEMLELEDVEPVPILVDLRDGEAVAQALREHPPSAVFHSAAYKFVTMTEANPREAFRVNVLGTQHLLDALQGGERFVYFSSGKAADPFASSVLGLTKQLAEYAVLAFAQRHPATRCSIVRFTHVIEGSLVINRFLKQIKAGQPVTVVHQEMKTGNEPPPCPSRIASMFQNVTEAADLALLAAQLGRRGEVFALRDYGMAVQIEDLARDLIRRSGRDVPIRYIPPRQGDSPREGKTGQALTANPMFNDRENHSAVVFGDVVRADSLPLAGTFPQSLRELTAALGRLPPAALKSRLDDLVWTYQQGRSVTADPRARVRERKSQIAADMDYLAGRRVLITGAGGLVGEALAQRVLEHGVSHLILVDFNENALKDVALRLRLTQERSGQSHSTLIVPRLINLQHRKQTEKVFRENQPQIIFHAAAYKLQPVIEENPCAAVVNNLESTINLMAAVRSSAQVERFVLVSTDKAAHPTAVYDITKRVGELLADSALHEGRVRYGMVRFGNVLEQSPVISLFYEQIRHELPLTVTHPRADRYFMRLDEAVSLILLAGARAERGETFVMEMGEPLSILDLAKTIIRELGQEPVEDATYRFIGLNPQEKLNEQLFAPEEETRGIQREGDVLIVPPAQQRVAFSVLDMQVRGLVNCLQHDELAPRELNLLLASIVRQISPR